MSLFRKNRRYTKYEYLKEAEFEDDIVKHSKVFFGEKTIYIDAKKKLSTESLGGTIPDGFFFDLSDKDDPQFYIVEVELVKHSFFSHIFPQITKFFAFFKNPKQLKILTEKLFTIITEDATIHKEFKTLIGDIEIHKFITDILDNSQNILLIIDGDKRELPEITDTYSDTWGKMVKTLVIKKFIDGSDSVFTMDPEYEVLEYYTTPEFEDQGTITKEFHLEDVGENVRKVFGKIESSLVKIDESLMLNPQKYYISIRSKKNICFIKFRKKKIRLIVMLPEESIRQQISAHDVLPLSSGVQAFYNGECAAIDIHNTLKFQEIIKIIQDANNYSIKIR
jgi:predicted transport protein